MIATMLRDLQQPEYIHVLINPLPVYGLACGLIGLFIAICQRSRRATIVALVIVLLSAAAAWPVYIYGEQAHDRVLSMADADGQAWLAAHKARAENLIWLFYAVAAVSVIALIAPVKWQRSSIALAIAVLVLGVISLGAGGYIAYAGGKIRHREFRTEPPPKETAAAVQPSSAGAVSAQVTIQALKYSPETIEIRKGETVEWVNNDLAPHTVTSQATDTFNSGAIDPDSSWSHTFSQSGTFPYYCTFHREMKGTINVK
jgi:plastocyanin